MLVLIGSSLCLARRVNESVDWPIAPRPIDLSPVEFRTLESICSGYSLSREAAKGYASKFRGSIDISTRHRGRGEY